MEGKTLMQLFRYLEFRDIVAFAVIVAFLIVGLGYAAEIAALIQAARAV
jgi:maleate cis-trans isomerase